MALDDLCGAVNSAAFDEIWIQGSLTDLVPAVNSEFDVVREAAEEFGLYDD